MSILGFHHITLICADAQRTIDFYTHVLGQYLVKKTVNFDAPDSYHLYFGDEKGSPGSAITFFEWRNATKGHPGIGGTHHFALQIPDYEGLLKWKQRLIDLGVQVHGPKDHHYFKSIYFLDPDGITLEIATQGPGFSIDENVNGLGTQYRQPPTSNMIENQDYDRIQTEIWSKPVPVITNEMTLQHGMHHITAISSDIERTHDFFGELLGMQRVKMTSNFDDPNSAHWYWGIGNGRPGTLVTYFERKPDIEPRARFGSGQTHHFALAIANVETQLEWRERLLQAGLPVSPVMDRIYFKSIYTRDPDGHIIELATLGPGFSVDEPPDSLGTQLMLPPWLESERHQIESNLHPVSTAISDTPTHAGTSGTPRSSGNG